MMRCTTFLLALTVLGFAHAQTPPDYQPSTDWPLIVKYGDLVITPDILVPNTTTLNQPKISLPWPCDSQEIYMLLCLDLSINALSPNIPATYTPAFTVPGIGPNRTTYLHWFQGNLTQASFLPELTPLPNTETLAPYVAPDPNPGDIAHVYGFYLLTQPEGFVLTGVNAGRVLEPMWSLGRIGFSLEGVVEEEGVELVAGTWLMEKAPA